MMTEALKDRIMRQAVRHELCTGRKATVVTVNPKDVDDDERDLAGIAIVRDARVPQGNAWVSSHVGGDA